MKAAEPDSPGANYSTYVTLWYSVGTSGNTLGSVNDLVQDASLGLLTTTTTKLLRKHVHCLRKKKEKGFYQKIVYSSCWCNHHHHPSPEVFHLPKLKPSTHKSFVPFHTAPGNHHSTSCLIESDYCRFLM